MREPPEVLARSELEGPAKIGTCTQILGIAVVSVAGIRLGLAPADFLGPVRRSIVADDELKICIGLNQDGIDGLSDIVFTVVNRQPDRDFVPVVDHNGPSCIWPLGPKLFQRLFSLSPPA